MFGLWVNLEAVVVSVGGRSMGTVTGSIKKMMTWRRVVQMAAVWWLEKLTCLVSVSVIVRMKGVATSIEIHIRIC